MINDLTNLSAGFAEPEGQSKGDLHINRNAATWNDSATLGTSVLPTEEKDGGITKLRAHSAQKHLPANRRAKLRELRSRVRILQKAFVCTRSIACADLYRKAIKVARGDIAELEAV